MLNLVREGEEDYIEAIRYRRRLKIFDNFLLAKKFKDFSRSFIHIMHIKFCSPSMTFHRYQFFNDISFARKFVS